MPSKTITTTTTVTTTTIKKDEKPKPKPKKEKEIAYFPSPKAQQKMKIKKKKSKSKNGYEKYMDNGKKRCQGKNYHGEQCGLSVASGNKKYCDWHSKSSEKPCFFGQFMC